MSRFAEDAEDASVEQDHCDHDDYEADILTGRAYCYGCGHSWYQTKEEIAAEERAYQEWCAWQNSRWRRFREWFSRRWYRRPGWLAPKAELRDDDIPF